MLLLQVLLMLIMLTPNNVATKQYVVVKGEEIKVKATTSLGSINCTYNSSRQADTLYLNRPLAKEERLVLYLPVKGFGCGNLLLNRDFQRTLKASDYPQVRVEVMELRQEAKQLKGSIRLQLAGKTKLLQNVNFCRKPNQTLSADLCLDFSDFELTTPNKLGGLVKVEEELQVTVELQLARPN